MKSDPLRLLLVEDNPGDARLLQENLIEAESEPFSLTHATSLASALRLMAARPFDAMLLDLNLPDSTGLETIERATAAAPLLPILVLTSLDDEALANEALSRGAQDYLVKGETGQRLLMRALRYAIQRKHAEDQLRAAKAELERRVDERTAQLRTLNAELEQRAAQLRHLAHELTQTEQRERRRLAEVLHDHLQQLLVAAKMQVDLHASRIGGPAGKKLGEVSDLLRQSIEEARSLTAELSPPILYSAGLVPALAWLAQWMHEKHGLTVVLDAAPEVDPHTEDLRVFLFQAVRELLFNVAKHAKTRRAEIRVRPGAGEIQVTVTDQGRGFDPARLAASSGFGLFQIRERLHLLGGRLDADSALGRGASFTLFVPIAPPSSDH